jgi:MFS family permease
MATVTALLRRNPNYRYLWIGQVVSEIGDYFNAVAVLALIMEQTGSGMVVSLVFLSRAIPSVLAAPFAGVLLDRLSRKHIMIASDLARAVIVLGFTSPFTNRAPGSFTCGARCSPWLRRFSQAAVPPFCPPSPAKKSCTRRTRSPRPRGGRH